MHVRVTTDGAVEAVEAVEAADEAAKRLIACCDALEREYDRATGEGR